MYDSCFLTISKKSPKWLQFKNPLFLKFWNLILYSINSVYFTWKHSLSLILINERTFQKLVSNRSARQLKLLSDFFFPRTHLVNIIHAYCHFYLFLSWKISLTAFFKAFSLIILKMFSKGIDFECWIATHTHIINVLQETLCKI